MLFYNESVKPKSFSNNITQESYMSDLTAIANLSILLVEPSEVQQKLIIKSLTQCGVTQVETASNQAQTLALLEKYQPDLVISSMYLADGTATLCYKAFVQTRAQKAKRLC